MTPNEVELIKTAYLGNYCQMKRLIDDGVNVHAVFDNSDRVAMNMPGMDGVGNGYTALMAACVKGHMRAVDVLLKNGADVNQGTIDAHPLLIAIRSGKVALVHKLLDAGAEIDRVNRIGRTVLFEVCILHQDSPMKNLLPMLLERGANANHPDNDQSTPLMHIITSGAFDKDAVRLLLEYKADPELSLNNRNAFDCAKMLGREDFIDFIKSAQENIQLNKAIENKNGINYSIGGILF